MNSTWLVTSDVCVDSAASPDQQSVSAPRGQEQLHVVILSQRGISRAISRCCGYEFEDCIRAWYGSSLIAPRDTGWSSIRRRFIRRFTTTSPVFARAGAGETVDSSRDPVDVLLVLCQFPDDLMLLHAVKGWRRHCRYAVCWIEEVWASRIAKERGYLRMLRDFNGVFVNCHGSAAVVSDAIGRPCRYLPRTRGRDGRGRRG